MGGTRTGEIFNFSYPLKVFRSIILFFCHLNSGKKGECFPREDFFFPSFRYLPFLSSFLHRCSTVCAVQAVPDKHTTVGLACREKENENTDLLMDE